jgi:hypothetical protein
MLQYPFTAAPGGRTPPIAANRTQDFLRGALYTFSPMNITLSVVILVQNVLVIASYYKDRARFIPASFIAIATADILLAQGELTLSIVANLVYGSMKLDNKYLLYGLYFFQGIAAVGGTCSKFYNVVLSVVITLKVTLGTANISRVRFVTAVVTVILAVLHFSDGSAALYLDESERYHVYESYINTISTFVIPGLWTLISLSCFSGPNSALCVDPDGSTSWFTSLLFTLHVGAPPVIMLLSMLFLVFNISRTPVNETDKRHVSITVFLVSTLFFICHATLLGVAAFSYFHFHEADFVKETEFQYSYLTRGEVTGFAVFTLPLINAVLFPLILATRNRSNSFGAILDRFYLIMRELLTTEDSEDSEDYPYI